MGAKKVTVRMGKKKTFQSSRIAGVRTEDNERGKKGQGDKPQAPVENATILPK